MTILLLIRHGENDYMADALAGRLPDVHLNQNGQQQADLIKEHLLGEGIGSIFSSPLERAIETAKPLASALGLKIQIHPGLNEIDYGELQGRKFTEIRDLPIWKSMLGGKANVSFPGGESLATGWDRIVAAMHEIRESAGRDGIAACFTHGDVVRMTVMHILGLPLASLRQFHVQPASVTALAWGGQSASLLFMNHIFSEGFSRSLLDPFVKQKGG